MLAIVLLLASFQQGPDPIKQAIAALDADKPAEAIAILKPAVEKDAKDYVAWFHLGLAHALLGQDDEAVAAYKKVLAEQPELYEARLNLAQVLVRQKRPAEALPLVEAAAQQKPKEHRPLALWGEALLQQKAFAGAEEKLRAAQEIRPEDADIKSLLARALQGQGKREEAESAFRQAGEKNAAAALLEQRGIELLNAGKAAEAIPVLEQVLAESPTPAIRYALAIAYLRSKQPDKSLAEIQRLLAAEPKNLEARMLAGRLLRDQKNYPAAGAQFAEAVKIDAQSKEAWSELTGMLILLQQYPQALQSLEKLKQLQGETPAYFWFRATVLDASKQPELALAAYEKFLEVSLGKSPDEEFKARQRVRILKKVVSR